MKRLALRAASALHAGLVHGTHGRALASVAGEKVVLLTTTGNVTGRRRTRPMVGVLLDGDLYVVASHNGADEDPGWFRNVTSDPHVEVEVSGRTARVFAEVLTEPERSAVWSALVARVPAYARAQEKTDRTFPIVRLPLVASPG